MIHPRSDVLTKKKEALFQATATAAYDTLFPHAALGEILQEVPGRPTYRQLVLAVGKRLEKEANRVLASERGVGYRIAQPNEHVAMSHKRQVRSRRQIARAVQILQATPRQLLTMEERRRLDAAETIILAQANALRAVRQDVARGHAAIEEAVERRLAEMQALMQGLRRGPGDTA